MQKWKEDFQHVAELIYYNEEEHLRERTEHVQKVREYSERGQSILTNENVEEDDVYVMQGVIGNLLRIIGDTDQAIPILEENVQYAVKKEDSQKEAVSRIRLGEAQKYAGATKVAMKEFERAISMIDTHSLEHLRDFAYQHMGKLFLELGDYKKALTFFQKAYAIRLEKGDMELLSSTEDACTYARKKI